MKAKRKLSTAQGFFLARYSCGAEVLHCKRVTPETPYTLHCDCTKLKSSDAVCHYCACVPCATARAAWAKRIQKLRKAQSP